MFLMLPIHFSAYIIYACLCLAGFFLIRKFAQKDSLLIISIVSIILAMMGPSLVMFNTYITGAVIFMPFALFCLALMLKEKGEKEAIRLFFILLTIIGVMFVVYFILFAYLETIAWQYVGGFISIAVAFIISSFFYKLLLGKFSQKNYLSKALPLVVTSIISIASFIFLQLVFLNVPIGDLLLTILLGVAFSTITSFALAFVDMFLDKEYLKTMLKKEIEREDKPKQNNSKKQIKQDYIQEEKEEFGAEESQKEDKE